MNREKSHCSMNGSEFSVKMCSIRTCVDLSVPKVVPSCKSLRSSTISIILLASTPAGPKWNRLHRWACRRNFEVASDLCSNCSGRVSSIAGFQGFHRQHRDAQEDVALKASNLHRATFVPAKVLTSWKLVVDGSWAFCTRMVCVGPLGILGTPGI